MDKDEYILKQDSSSEIEYQRNYWKKNRKRRSPDHPVIEALAKSRIDFLNKYIDFNKGLKLLDVGCGNGFYTFHFSKVCNTIGLDYSSYMLSINPCEKLIQGSANLLPFKDNAFDVVFCSAMLHHVNDPNNVVAEMKRVSNRYVVLLEPNRNNPFMAIFSAIVKEERNALKFSLSYLKSIALNCNLEIIEACSLGFIAPNKTPVLMIGLSKLLDRKMPLGFGNLVISCK